MPCWPLVPGQRLDQRTFHERYEATTPETRAGLIGGIVYLTPPHRDAHGQILMALTYCLGTYQWKTKGVEGAGRVTIKMDDLCEVEPDCGLRIPRELGGRSWVDEDGYVSGIPELLIEIDDYSREIDLGPRKADYERVGVREYVFVGLHPQELRRFVQRDGQLAELPCDEDGVFRSRVFPGLWLDIPALHTDDLSRLVEVAEQGLASPAHAKFAARLAKKRQGSGGTV